MSEPRGPTTEELRARATAKGAHAMRRLTIETHESVVYDTERVRALYEQFQPDPTQYGDEPVYALYAYLAGSPLGADVFENQGDYGQWPLSDEPHDPDA